MELYMISKHSPNVFHTQIHRLPCPLLLYWENLFLFGKGWLSQLFHMM